MVHVKPQLSLLLLLAVLLLALGGCEFRRARQRAVEEVRDLVGDARNTRNDKPQSLPTPDVAVGLPPVTATEAEPGHPRLFFAEAEIPQLRARAETTHHELAASVERHMEAHLDTVPEIDFLARGNLDTFRDYGDQVLVFALACTVSEKPAVCDLARTYLLTMSGWAQWGEDEERGLGLSHMLMGNAIAYDWLYGRLSAEEQVAVRASLAHWAQQLYEASATREVVPSWNNWWHSAYAQNHYFIANSALGMAGLALLDEVPEAETWVNHAAARMARVHYLLEGIADGTWHEGLSYQAYALTLSLPFLVNLRAVTGIDLLPHDYLRSYTTWRLYNYLPDSAQFLMAFGDFEWTYLGPRTPNILRFIAAEYGDGHAEWLAQQLIAQGARRDDARSAAWTAFEFLYYDPSVPPRPPTELPPAQVFPDLEGVIWRSGWQAEDLVFGLKTGAYGGRFAFTTFTAEAYPWDPPCRQTGCQLSMGHDHADANTFYLYGDGGWLVPEEVIYGRALTVAHNTLLVDGKGQVRPGVSDRRDPESFAGYDGYLEATASVSGFDYVAADATRPYQVADLRDFTRYVLFVRPDYFVILDNLQAEKTHRYDWIIHFGGEVARDGDWLRGGPGARLLDVRVLAPRPFAASLENGSYPYASLRPERPQADVRFINLLYPTDEAGWERRPTVSLLEDNGQLALIRVELEAATRSDDILLTYSGPGSPLAAGPYRYDGRTAVIRRSGAGQLQQLFLYGGTFLEDVEAAQMLLMLPAAALPLAATYDGTSVAVLTETRGEITLYAPQVEQLTVNGQPYPFARNGDQIRITLP